MLPFARMETAVGAAGLWGGEAEAFSLEKSSLMPVLDVHVKMLSQYRMRVKIQGNVQAGDISLGVIVSGVIQSHEILRDVSVDKEAQSLSPVALRHSDTKERR